MGRGPLSFKATDVTRAMRAIDASGHRIIRTEIRPDGGIVFVHVEHASPVEAEETYEQWKARTGANAS